MTSPRSLPSEDKQPPGWPLVSLALIGAGITAFVVGCLLVNVWTWLFL